MSRTARLWILLSVVPLLAVAADAKEGRIAYSASAYALGSDRLLYVEKHIETWEDGRLSERQVRYEDPAGELIAEKLVRYGTSPEAPSFEMQDFRLGRREGAEVGPEQVALYSGPADESPDRRRVSLPEVAVIDAGFDAFMRENFDAVRAGERIEFEFAVPSMQRFFRFQLVPEGETRYGGESALRVTMRPASPFLRFLVDPIDLVYSRDGRLLEFRGLANVWNREGERYEARIVFDYPASGPSVARVGAAR